MSKKDNDKAQVAKGKRMVKMILAHHLGSASPVQWKIKALSGGLSNQVFCAQHDRESVIVRLGTRPEKISSFMKEQWAISRAAELGVPGPEVLQVGNQAANVPYMIARRTKGTEATNHPERLTIVREMGRYAAIIHSIKTTGFGETFDWSQNQLSYNETWKDFLKNELKMEERLEVLERNQMLDARRIKKLRKVLESAASKGRAPSLNHGDLRLKNVLVGEKGAISCILDWEHCTSNLSPEWEFSLALHDLAIDEKQAFVEGYALNSDQIQARSELWKAINLVNYAPTIKAAEKADKTDTLEQYRLRLHGDLDLYCL